MRGDHRVGAKAEVGADARPRVVLGMIGHGGTNEVEFDAAVRRHQVGFAVDNARFEAALPKRVGPAMPEVEGPHVALVKAAHGAG